MSRRVTIALLLAPSLLVVGVLFVGGLVAVVQQSLGYLPALGQTQISLDAYRELWESGELLDSLLLTTWIALVSTALSTVIAVALALWMRRSTNCLAAFFFQLPITVPHLVAAAGIALVISQTGMGARAADWLGLIDEPHQFPALLYDRAGVGIILTYVWKEVPFIALVVLAALRGVAGDLEDVARTHGAGSWYRLRHVVLPVIAPGVVAAALTVFAFTFGAFEVPKLLGETYPTTLPVLAYDTYRDIDPDARPVAMAANVIVTVATALFAAAYLRIARGTGRSAA